MRRTGRQTGRPTRRPRRCRWWHRNRAIYKPSTSTTSPSWRRWVGTRCSWSPSSATTSPPGLARLVLAPGAPPSAPGADVAQRYLRHVHIGYERTLQQDVRFGLRQLVDVALRALSPALNDPYTAIQVVHHLSAVESVLAARALPDEVRRNGAGEPLVWIPHPGFATYLHVGCAQIRRYGTREPLVLTALLQLLSAVAQNCVDPSRRAAVRTQIALVVQAAQRELADESDRATVIGAAARAREVVERPGTLAPPASAFGQLAAAKAAAATIAVADGAVG